MLPFTLQKHCQAFVSISVVRVRAESGSAPITPAWQPAQFMEMVITSPLTANATALVEIVNTPWSRY